MKIRSSDRYVFFIQNAAYWGCSNRNSMPWSGGRLVTNIKPRSRLRSSAAIQTSKRCEPDAVTTCSSERGRPAKVATGSRASASAAVAARPAKASSDSRRLIAW
jgi:hypothetical protein